MKWIALYEIEMENRLEIIGISGIGRTNFFYSILFKNARINQNFCNSSLILHSLRVWCRFYAHTLKIILIKVVVLKCVIPKSLHSWRYTLLRYTLLRRIHQIEVKSMISIRNTNPWNVRNFFFVFAGGAKSEWKSKPKGKHSIPAKHAFIPNNIGWISQLNGFTLLSLLHIDVVYNFFFRHCFHLYSKHRNIVDDSKLSSLNQMVLFIKLNHQHGYNRFFPSLA